MSKQILRSQKTYAYIRGTTPFLQRRRVEVVVRRWTIVQQTNGNLTTLEGHNLRVFHRTDYIVIVLQRFQTVRTKECDAVGRRVGEVLPGRPCFAVITRFLERPQTRSWRVPHTDEQISHVEFLTEVDREVDFVVLHTTGQRGTLPPVLRTVDGVLRRVILVRIGRITHIANLSLDDLGVLVLVVVLRVCTDQFTV